MNKWVVLVTEDGEVWIDGVKKRNPPQWTQRVAKNFNGLACIQDDIIEIYKTTHRVGGYRFLRFVKNIRIKA